MSEWLPILIGLGITAGILIASWFLAGRLADDLDMEPRRR